MGHTLIRILAAGTLVAAFIISAAWWLRAWAQYNADETVMAAAMAARDDDEDSDYCT